MRKAAAYRRQALLVTSLVLAFVAPSLAFSGKGEQSKGGWSRPEILPVVGSENLMIEKAHGTCVAAPQESLRYGCSWDTANSIACHNRHFAEYAGYFEKTKWLDEVRDKSAVTYYDVVTGKPLFKAPQGRSFEEFLAESRRHGWPSFRDEEVVWENVRCLPNGETVSVDGTHLGHNLPDGKNRYCINLVSIAGHPA